LVAEKRDISETRALRNFHLMYKMMTSYHNSSELEIHDHSNEPSSSKLVPNVVPLACKTATTRQALELLFHHHITMLRYLRLFASRKKPKAMISSAGAPEAAEDALVVDEGALAVPSPIKAPQPPHPIVGPTRTMAQRLALVEEDVHVIQGALDKQREVLDSMACDVS
nr:hypothetical protein [Tanacetum cinerariifolium]